MTDRPSHDVQIEIRDLTMAYGSFVVMRGVSAQIRRGEVFFIMGGSGCGKSTLLKHLIGLRSPAAGEIRYEGRSYWDATPDEQELMRRRFGVMFQHGALWSSLTLAENIALPLETFTALDPDDVGELVRVKLALVGLRGFEDYYPAEISGGMRKRAALARAMALDPEILFFDEPSAGLDPVSSRRLDDLILEMRDSLGATIVVVSHELASILAIADNGIFLDAASRSVRAQGNPRDLLEHSTDPAVRAFLTRGGEAVVERAGRGRGAL